MTATRNLLAIDLGAESGRGVLWVDLDVASSVHREWLEKIFRFHPLSIEDTLSAEGRVKFEVFEHYALAVVRGVRYREETADLYDIETFNLWCFLGRNYVVTVRGAHAPGVVTALAAGTMVLRATADVMTLDLVAETGALDNMLYKVADVYDEEVSMLVEGLVNLLEPLMVVVLGLIVGFIVIALFMPLVKLLNELS